MSAIGLLQQLVLVHQKGQTQYISLEQPRCGGFAMTGYRYLFYLTQKSFIVAGREYEQIQLPVLNLACLVEKVMKLRSDSEHHDLLRVVESS